MPGYAFDELRIYAANGVQCLERRKGHEQHPHVRDRAVYALQLHRLAIHPQVVRSITRLRWPSTAQGTHSSPTRTPACGAECDVEHHGYARPTSSYLQAICPQGAFRPARSFGHRSRRCRRSPTPRRAASSSVVLASAKRTNRTRRKEGEGQELGTTWRTRATAGFFVLDEPTGIMRVYPAAASPLEQQPDVESYALAHQRRRSTSPPGTRYDGADSEPAAMPLGFRTARSIPATRQEWR